MIIIIIIKYINTKKNRKTLTGQQHRVVADVDRRDRPVGREVGGRAELDLHTALTSGHRGLQDVVGPRAAEITYATNAFPAIRPPSCATRNGAKPLWSFPSSSTSRYNATVRPKKTIFRMFYRCARSTCCSGVFRASCLLVGDD